MRSVVLVSAVRTPIGSFQGKLSSITAPKLGGISIAAAINRAGISPSEVQEVFMGNVLSAGLGQAPARQAAINAGLPNSTICTTVNKMCASGMKSVMLGAQSIMLGHQDCVVAGGFESMTNAPFYLPNVRSGQKLGDFSNQDAILKDGLTDAYNGKHMGWCAEECARKYKITREQQDMYAIQSYQRAADAVKAGKFRDEIVPITIPQKKGDPLVFTEDEEFTNIKLDKIATLNPAFVKEGGTVTAANSSKISDGASALVLVSEEKAKRAGLRPLARIRGFADAEQHPTEFTTTPSIAIPRALRNAGLSASDVSLYEINEAFSVVALANLQLLNLDQSRVNVFGGAVSLGHPIGCSGARIIATLYSALKHNNGSVGVAAICNGGGGASAIVIERLI